MTARPADTPHLLRLLERVRAGDAPALDELLRRTAEWLKPRVEARLRAFPVVGRSLQGEDVTQNVLIRLVRALEQVRPESEDHYFGLVDQQVRRELLDLARYYGRRQGTGSSAELCPIPAACADHRDSGAEESDLERWSAFHEQVRNLPTVDREIVALQFYHDWPQERIAELFHMTVRTVRRRWRAAQRLLRMRLAGHEGREPGG